MVDAGGDEDGAGARHGDVLREDPATLRRGDALRFRLAGEPETPVLSQIDQSPAGGDFVRGDQSFRHGEVAEVGDAGLPDVFEAAALMECVEQFFQLPAQFAVTGVSAGGVVPAAEFAEEVVGGAEFRLGLPDLRFELFLFGAQGVDCREPGVAVGAVGKAVFKPFIKHDDGGSFDVAVVSPFSPPESGRSDLILPETRRYLNCNGVGVEGDEKTQGELLEFRMGKRPFFRRRRRGSRGCGRGRRRTPGIGCFRRRGLVRLRLEKTEKIEFRIGFVHKALPSTGSLHLHSGI